MCLLSIYSFIIRNDLNLEQEYLEKEIIQFQKSTNLFDTVNDENTVSIRNENIKFYEFCQKNDINHSDRYGGWKDTDHQKYVFI